MIYCSYMTIKNQNNYCIVSIPNNPSFNNSNKQECVLLLILHSISMFSLFRKIYYLYFLIYVYVCIIYAYTYISMLYIHKIICITYVMYCHHTFPTTSLVLFLLWLIHFLFPPISSSTVIFIYFDDLMVSLGLLRGF